MHFVCQNKVYMPLNPIFYRELEPSAWKVAFEINRVAKRAYAS